MNFCHSASRRSAPFTWLSDCDGKPSAQHHPRIVCRNHLGAAVMATTELGEPQDAVCARKSTKADDKPSRGLLAGLSWDGTLRFWRACSKDRRCCNLAIARGPDRQPGTEKGEGIYRKRHVGVCVCARVQTYLPASRCRYVSVYAWTHACMHGRMHTDVCQSAQSFSLSLRLSVFPSLCLYVSLSVFVCVHA